MNPFTPLYEIHTATFLNKLSRKYDRRITLGSIPEEEIQRLINLGINCIWLMGVWTRSNTARDIALNDQQFISEIENSLPDFRQEDLIGSAYSIAAYQVDERFGTEDELQALRKRLNDLGIKLILDFVPNHVAFDHVWVEQNDDYFIKATEEDMEYNPEGYVKLNGQIYAKGKDPTFPAWSDVVQLNALSESYRNESVKTINQIASLCDGVRCDMAMLMLNHIFANTWKSMAGEVPKKEYWQEVISQIKQKYPLFCFIAEAYWDTEEELVSLGFDFCYDKQLYDYLLEGYGSSVSKYIAQTISTRKQFVSFTENHDEARVSTVLSDKQALAAFAVVLSLPGIVLIHDGQLEGFRLKIPVHVNNISSEEVNDSLYSQQKYLLERFKQLGRWNDWQLLDSDSDEMLAFIIYGANSGLLVLVNYSSSSSYPHIYTDSPLPFKDQSSKEITNLKNGISMNPWEVKIVELTLN